jgi:hypothetical protein
VRIAAAYSDKFGSIAGCGPGRLVALYDTAAQRVAELPRLPSGLEAGTWTDVCAQVES